MSQDQLVEMSISLSNADEWIAYKLDSLAYYSTGLDGVEIPASKTISPMLKEAAVVLGAAAKLSRETSLLRLGLGKGFKSFDSLKNHLGSAGDGKVWHHLVEQCQVKCTRANFPAEMIQNTKNVRAAPNEVNKALNKLYSANLPGLKLTLRDWLSTKPYKFQQEFGKRELMKAMKEYEKNQQKRGR